MSAGLRVALQALARATKLVVLQRAALLFVVWLGALTTRPTSPVIQEFSGNNALFAMLMRWDAAYYWHIARDGYNNVSDAFEHRDTNFWPLFPWLWRLFHYVIPSWALSGFVLNLVLLIVAVAAISDIANRVLPRASARVVPYLFLAHPFAFYYSAYYTETTFIAFSALGICLALRRRWALAALVAGLAGASRMVGLAAGVAVAVAYLESIEFNPRRMDRNALWFPLLGLGTALYCGYLAWKFHDPIAFTAGLRAKDWGADVTWARFGQTLLAVADVKAWPLSWRVGTDTTHLVLLVGTIVITAVGLPSMRPSLAVFAALTLFLSCRYWTNAGRYCAPIFPAMFVLSRWVVLRPNLLVFFLTFGLLGSAVIGWLYVNAFWVS